MIREWDYQAFINCYLALGQCIEDKHTGVLRDDFIDALCWCVGWQWYDIRNDLIVDGVLAMTPLGRTRVTKVGQALCLMAVVAEHARLLEKK